VSDARNTVLAIERPEHLVPQTTARAAAEKHGHREHQDLQHAFKHLRCDQEVNEEQAVQR